MVANALAAVDEFNEPVIVIFRHRDVDVVVPGDEALMAGSAEQGAIYEPIAKAVFFGEIVKGAKHLEFDALQIFELQFGGLFLSHPETPFRLMKILHYIAPYTIINKHEARVRSELYANSERDCSRI